LRHDLVFGGCSIYLDRPKTCRVFLCGWIREEMNGVLVPEEFRPDRCGIVFTWLLRGESAHGETVRELVGLEGEGPCALEVWDGAAEKEDNARLIATMAKSFPVYVATREGISVIPKTGGTP
jgi:hypothetical protein